MNGNESAYPHAQRLERDANDQSYCDSGLSKRELIAAMVLQGLCANPSPQHIQTGSTMMAEWSVDLTNALLAELAKEKQ